MQTAVRPVLVVEDDPALRATLCEWLEVTGGFAADEAGTVSQAEARLAASGTAHYDAVLLDVGLPDGDGRDLCARLRCRDTALPVILLTGADDEADVVRGLDAGANDYVTKPFRPGELLARLRAQLRTFDAGPDAPLAIGRYVLRPSTMLLVDRTAGREIKLSNREAALLARLCRAGGKPVAWQVLLGEIWGYSPAAETHTLETHVYRLRQKIEANPAKPALLLTGKGSYRIAAPEGLG